MLSVTNFDINVVKSAFEIVLSHNNIILVNQLFTVLKSDSYLISQTLCSLSKNNYYDLIQNIYHERKHLISDIMLYECFVISSKQGHVKTAQIIRSLNPIQIDNLIFSDINKTPFIKAMINSQYLILDILNDMKQYQITVYLEEIEIIKMQFNEYQIDQIIKQLLNNTQINKLNIVSDNNLKICFDNQIHHNLFIENISQSVYEFNKTKYEKIFKCKQQNTEILCNLKFIIITEHYIDSNYLNKILKTSTTIIQRDEISRLLGRNMYPIQDLKYRDIMNPYLNLKIAQITDPLIQRIIHESDECQICSGQNDMMLSCGHQMCIRCCMDWYIINKNSLICYVCQQPFVMTECFCLC